jgi:pimeloyl-ACP methyl ester carboxylesterase
MLVRVGEPLRTLDTPDGRTLAYAVWGDPNGFAIFALHGTPGCRLERWPDEDLYRRLGVMVVTHDRAGYGKSDRRRGRCVADEADDVRALADELGVDRFGVTGASGGGPHALACAALLPDRVVRATCLVGIAPHGASGLQPSDWVAEMDRENVKEYEWMLAGEEVLERELAVWQKQTVERVSVNPSNVLAGFDLSESDRAQLARPELMQIISESTLEQAAGTIYGWVDDDLAFLRPWGFDPGDIAVPVLVWYGAADVLSPPKHGEWLAANVPDCLVKVDSHGGHMGLDPETEIAENFRWLADGVAPNGASPRGG